KLDRESASGYHRFTMAVLATSDVSDVWVSSWELERDAVSYTVDTLGHLRSEHADATLDWIIGDDNLPNLAEWKSLDTIFELANFAVLARRGARVPDQFNHRVHAARSRPSHGAVVLIHNDAVPV